MPIHGYPGNVITANPTAPTVSSASGVWTTEQQLLAVSQGNWPGYEYPLANSLRFNSADTAYLNRTFTTPTNAKKFTISAWIKVTSPLGSALDFGLLCSASSAEIIGISGTGAFGAALNGRLFIRFGDTNLVYYPQIFRDVSAWGHIVVAIDTDQAVQADRAKFYYNGVLQTATSSAITSGYSPALNTAATRYIGSLGTNAGYYANGYLTEYNFIDGQALDSSSFGLNDPETGVWSPKRYTGTYGTNGFYLPFNFDVTNFSADYLVVAGGGGGGKGDTVNTYSAGGGGAGGYRELASQTLTVGTAYTVTVGGGGAAATSTSAKGSNGSNSVFGSTTSTGGGGGGSYLSGNTNGASGGSGGGAGGFSGTGGTATSGQGNAGGNTGTAVNGGAGGGGATSAGSSVANSGQNGANGGAGTSSSITGSSVPRGGGGGGSGVVAGTGGTGGGGNGGIAGTAATSGSANTGGGGGGLSPNTAGGGVGGSGVVIIKIPSYLTATFSGGVTSSLSTAVSGFKIYTVTATSTTSETVTFS